MHGCVLVWHVIQGVLVYQWHMVMKNEYITHWTKLPEGPAESR